MSYWDQVPDDEQPARISGWTVLAFFMVDVVLVVLLVAQMRGCR